MTPDPSSPRPRPRRSAIVQEHVGEARRIARSIQGATPPPDMESGLVEFLTAVDEYKRHCDRPFPNLSEIYAILIELGYTKAA